MKRVRVEAWDFVKTATITLVIYGHLMQYCIATDIKFNPIWCWIYSFHMPLFMTLSGMFAMYGYNSSTFIGYCKKRTLRILVPCIVWLLIVSGCYMLIDDNLRLLTLVSVIKGGLWFLKAVFLCGILGYIAMKSHGKKWLFITIIISQFFQMWSVSTMYPCFLLGILIYKNLNWFRTNWKVVALICTILFFIISIPISYCPLFWEIRSSSLLQTESFHGIMLIQGCRYLTMFTGMLASTSLIIGSYMLFENVARFPMWIHKVADAGRYTLGVYVIQTVVVETLLPLYFKLPEMIGATFWLVNLIVFPIISVILTWLFTWITACVCRKFPIGAMILFGEKMQCKIE